MSCYSSISSSVGVKRVNISNLPKNVETVLKEKANKYGLDWKWLGAMAWVESNWRTNAKNSIGYCGLFQWHENCKDINQWLGRQISNIFDVNDQTEASAKRMASNVKSAQQKGLRGEDCYLYAGLCHNAGEGGAEFILSKCSPKTVYQMTQRIKNIPSSDIKWGWMRTSEKRKEISEYPVKMKSAYVSISAKYS